RSFQSGPFGAVLERCGRSSPRRRAIAGEATQATRTVGGRRRGHRSTGPCLRGTAASARGDNAMLNWPHTAARVATMPAAIQPHILIVDDDPSIRALLTEYFTENGLRVSSAETSAEMSAILADTAIDLVVLDLRLAGEDGMAIARTLRGQSAIPIIMLTGVRDEADRV